MDIYTASGQSLGSFGAYVSSNSAINNACGSGAHYFGYYPGRRHPLRNALQRLVDCPPYSTAGNQNQRAAEIFAVLVQRPPQDWVRFRMISDLGSAQMLLGRLSEAEQSYRTALALQPRNPEVILNLADIALLSGRAAEAASLYSQALQFPEEVPKATYKWSNAVNRAVCLAHLGQKNEAVAAVQKALRLAPDNPQVSQAVSLVYVLIEDQTSARYNAGRALRQGCAPHWFRFPWFAPLWDSPELRPLLKPLRAQPTIVAR